MRKKQGKYQHLSLEKRFTIERMLLSGFRPAEIAIAVGCCIATVYNEKKRAIYSHTVGIKEEVRYAPETAHDKYREKLKKKGRTPTLLQDENQRKAIEALILEKNYSPAAAIEYLKAKEKDKSCVFSCPIVSINTVYKGIERGYFENLTLEMLPDKGRHKRKGKRRVKQAKRGAKGTSIENRPKDVDTRQEFGHWEMDTVHGKQTNRKCLLVLTERLSRKEIIEPLKANTAIEVVRALNRIEKMYGCVFFKLFKSITVDNGSEFADFDGMEKALYRVGKRTDVYYCHPSCPHERGSNEVNNKLVRRRFPKGADFDKIVNKKAAKRAEVWMNTMPRKLFCGKTSDEVFRENMLANGLM